MVDLPDGILGQCAGDRIWLDKSQLQAERRSTLAHELVHLDRGAPPADPVLAAREERAVDLEAARRLIPLEDLADALLWARDEAELADALWVDEATARARLNGLTAEEQAYVESRTAAREESA